MKDYLNHKEYQDYLFDNYYISELDWVDSETCREMCKFADKIEEKYQTVLNIPFLLLAGYEFMDEYYLCSCPVRENHFNGFEEFLIKKIEFFAAKK
jgi:hypothetical protein